MLKEKLQEAFPQEISSTADCQMGYFVKSNTKRWIVEKKDLSVMYESFDIGSDITLWCDGIRESGNTGGEPPSKKRKTDGQAVVSDTVVDDENFKKLKEKHPDMSCPKLRLWAKLISKGRYDDFENVPPIPLLQDDSSLSTKKKNCASDALVDAVTAFAQVFKSPNVTPQKISCPTQISSKLSPMKYAQLRRSSLEDLKTLKNLCEEDIISESEFAEEKERVLTTLKSLQ